MVEPRPRPPLAGAALALLLLLLLLLLAPPAAAQTGRFRFGLLRDVRIAQDAFGTIRVADADEDGFPDLLALWVGYVFNDARLVVVLNDRAGGFHTPLEVPLEGFVDAMVTGDWNMDGHVDVAISHPTVGDWLSLLLGDGAGGFSEERIPVDLPFHTAAAADVDGDGRLDLVGTQGGRVSVLLGDGAGGFAPPRLSPADFPPDVLVPVDLDEDGRIDLAFTGSSAERFGLLFGEGDGRFGSFRGVATDSTPVDVDAGDLDEDGHADLLVTQASGAQVFRGDGHGGLEPLSAAVPGVPEATGEALLSDWNRDGHLDACFLSQAAARLVLALGDGTGGFEPLRERSVGQVGEGLVVADFDRDGDRDTAFPKVPGRVAILPGDGRDAMREDEGTGGFDVPLLTAPAVPVDLNEDGHVDLAAGTGGMVRLFLGDGRGGFDEEAPPIRNGATAVLVRAADLNGDGHQDLAMFAAQSALQLQIWVGEGTGGFDLAYWRNAASAQWRPRDLDVVDLDGDGDLDLVEPFGDSLRLHFNDGLGTDFERVYLDLGATASAVAPADLDGDGDVDLAVSLGDGTVAVLLGDGAGGFPEMRTFPAITFGDLETSDVNEDGDPDLVLVSNLPIPEGLIVLLGDGAGNFMIDASYPTAGELMSLVLEDLDGDGHTDALLRGRWMELLAGDGRGGFGPFSLVWSGDDSFIWHMDPVAVDFDEDGRLDLVDSQAWYRERVNLLRNQSFDSVDCRTGEVNAGVGPRADVLLVNGSAGEGPERRIVLGLGDPFEVRVELPPGEQDRAPFALYAWDRSPYAGSAEKEPWDLGRACLPTPLGPSFLAPVAIWNNTGRPGLGEATRPSEPAPARIGGRMPGHGLAGTYFLQGIIVDRGAPNGRAAVTNGVELRFE